MQGSPDSLIYTSITVLSETKSIQITIQLIVPSRLMKVINTWALVDSGADIFCIDQDFVKKYNLTTPKLTILIQSQNSNHSHNKNGDILYTCDLFLDIQGLAQQVTLHVMTCGKENMILGLPWLKKANPTVNWATQTLTFNESIEKFQELYQHYVTNTAWHSSHY